MDQVELFTFSWSWDQTFFSLAQWNTLDDRFLGVSVDERVHSLLICVRVYTVLTLTEFELVRADAGVHVTVLHM